VKEILFHARVEFVLRWNAARKANKDASAKRGILVALWREPWVGVLLKETGAL